MELVLCVLAVVAVAAFDIKHTIMFSSKNVLIWKLNITYADHSTTESLFFRPDIAQPVIKILECCIHEPSVSIFVHIKLQNTMP
jgi:hypothetical protein